MVTATAAAEIVPEEIEIKWTINSKKFAYPNMTFEEVADKITASYSLSLSKTKAIVEAYGLEHHHQVIAELELIAEGNLMTILSTTAWKHTYN